MKTNGTKSLTQLTGFDWGDAPEGSGTIVRERHEFRQTALNDLSIEALKRLLTIDFKDDSLFLIPHCLQRIEGTFSPFDKRVFESAGLLLTVLSNETFDWLKRPDLVHKVRELVEQASYAFYLSSNDAEQTNDSLAYYKVLVPNTQFQSTLFEKLSMLERRLSKVEPTST